MTFWIDCIKLSQNSDKEVKMKVVECIDCGRFLGVKGSSLSIFLTFLGLLFGGYKIDYGLCPECLKKQQNYNHFWNEREKEAD